MPPTYELPVTAPVLSQPLIALFSARPTMPLTYELPMTAPVLLQPLTVLFSARPAMPPKYWMLTLDSSSATPTVPVKVQPMITGPTAVSSVGAPLEERLFSPLLIRAIPTMPPTDAQPETVQALSQFATVAGASDSFVSKTGSGVERMRELNPTMPPTCTLPVTVPALLQPLTTLSIAPPTMPPILYSPVTAAEAPLRDVISSPKRQPVMVESLALPAMPPMLLIPATVPVLVQPVIAQ